MKRFVLGVGIFAIVASCSPAFASDYKGEESRGSVFQVIGDFIKGDYKVDGKPLKEKGIIQTIADQTKGMELSTMDKKQDNYKAQK